MRMSKGRISNVKIRDEIGGFSCLKLLPPKSFSPGVFSHFTDVCGLNGKVLIMFCKTALVNSAYTRFGTGNSQKALDSCPGQMFEHGVRSC